MDEHEFKIDDEWFRLTLASQLADVSRVTLHRAAVGGELPFAIIGGQRFFLVSDVLKWRDERQARRSLPADRGRE